MRLAIVVGHTWRSPGAYSPHLKMHEHEFNSMLATAIVSSAEADPVLRPQDIGVFWRDGHGVSGAYRNVAAWGLRGDKGKLSVVELHFNSFGDPKANGTETLFGQEASKSLARSIQSEMTQALGLTNRGIKDHTNGRGSGSLKGIPNVPTVIVEPFFGSNENDCNVVKGKIPQLAIAILRGATSSMW